MKKISEVKKNTKSVLNGLDALVQSVALLVVSGVSIYYALHYTTNTYVKAGILVFAGVITLRGSREFIRHLNKLGE